MSALSRHILIGFFAIAAFASLPRDVRASCGDYLQHEPLLEWTDDAPGTGLPAQIASGNTPRPKPASPCQNGSCRRAPDAPPIPSVPAPLTSSPSSDGIRSAIVALATDHCIGPLMIRDALALDDIFVWEIEHPPRCA